MASDPVPGCCPDGRVLALTARILLLLAGLLAAALLLRPGF